MNIDFDDSPLITYIFMLIIADISLFIVFICLFIKLSNCSSDISSYVHLFFLLFFADLDVHWVSCVVLLLNLFIEDVILFMVLNDARHLDGRLVSTI